MSETMDAPSEAELVVAMQQGSEEAFAELYQQYVTTVYGVALRRCRNRTQAEEITQEVFAIVHKKKDQLRDPESFAGWLKRTTIRLTINHIVRAPREHVMPVDNLDRINPESPDVSLVRKEQAAHVRMVLESGVCALDRATLTAFYFEGLSLVEMSNVFQAPVGTIKRRLHTARKRLRDAMCVIGITDIEL